MAASGIGPAAARPPRPFSRDRAQLKPRGGVGFCPGLIWAPQMRTVLGQTLGGKGGHGPDRRRRHRVPSRFLLLLSGPGELAGRHPSDRGVDTVGVVVPVRLRRPRLGVLESLKVVRVDVVAPGVLWNDPAWPLCCGVLAHARSALMPRTDMAFPSSPPVHCEPSSHRTRIPRIWSGASPPAAARTDCTALAGLAGGEDAGVPLAAEHAGDVEAAVACCATRRASRCTRARCWAGAACRFRRPSPPVAYQRRCEPLFARGCNMPH